MLLYLIALQHRLDHLLLIALFWDPTKRGYEFMSLSVLKLFSLWPLSESLSDKAIEALFNLTQFFIIRLSSKATVMYFLSKKQFLTSGEKMTQKSNFLGKQTKITVSRRIGLRGKISQQQQIKLLLPRKSQRALAGRFSTQHSPRSSNSRTPFVLHSKLSTLLSGLAGHSFSCSLYCILTHPCELFRRKSIPANHFNFSWTAILPSAWSSICFSALA